MRLKSTVAAIAAVLGLFMFFGVLLSPTVGAQDVVSLACKGAEGSDLCKGVDPGTNPIIGPEGIVTKATSLLAVVTAVIAVIVIIVAGLSMTTSSGNPQAITQARDAIIYAAVALGVAALAQTFVVFILSKL